MITWATLETPDFRWSVANALSGHLPGIICFIVWVVLFVALMKFFKKRNEKLATA